MSRVACQFENAGEKFPSGELQEHAPSYNGALTSPLTERDTGNVFEVVTAEIVSKFAFGKDPNKKIAGLVAFYKICQAIQSQQVPVNLIKGKGFNKETYSTELGIAVEEMPRVVSLIEKKVISKRIGQQSIEIITEFNKALFPDD